MLRLQVKIGENCDHDGAGLGEDFVLVQQKVLARVEIFDSNAHHAVEMLVDILNLGLEFLPENLLLGGGRNCGLSKARGKQQQATK